MRINGHNLHVEQAGPKTGPAVVLLHHGLGSTKAWRGQVGVLAEAGFRVVVYDRWGYGGSDPRPKLDLPSFTTDLVDLELLLDQLKIQQASLVGHSDGGTLALYFAAEQPKRVRCLVVVAAHVYQEPKMEPGILEVQKAYETEERFRTGLKLAHGEKYDSVFYNWFDGWYREENLAWDMRALLARINCPVFVVQGEQDEHALPQHARDIAGCILGADLWIVPGARHMLPQENTDIFNSRLLLFLEQHGWENDHVR